MTLSIPTLCAFLGTALMAIAIFAPRRSIASNAAATPALRLPVFDWHTIPAPSADLPVAAEPPPYAPSWPELVDPAAVGLDATSRGALARALVACDGDWALTLVAAALRDEPDAGVREIFLENG